MENYANQGLKDEVNESCIDFSEHFNSEATVDCALPVPTG